jgi:hypothetical protein
MNEEDLAWRTFVDRGDIADKWKPAGTPAYFLLDHKGVIRYKWAGAPGQKAINAGVAKLIGEAEIEGKKP